LLSEFLTRRKEMAARPRAPREQRELQLQARRLRHLEKKMARMHAIAGDKLLASQMEISSRLASQAADLAEDVAKLQRDLVRVLNFIHVHRHDEGAAPLLQTIRNLIEFEDE
jgi:LPS sulfotransferase NodH